METPRKPAPSSIRSSDGARRAARRARALPLPLLILATSLILPACRCTPPEEPGPQRVIPWRDTWPVLVLADPAIADHLTPLEAFSATWLTDPGRSTAESWPEAAQVPFQFRGPETSADIGQARAFQQHADAMAALATLYDEALCRMGRSEASFGDSVPVGYRFGAEACQRAGDSDGAGLARGHWEALAAADDPAHAMTWPPVLDENLPLTPAHVAVHHAHGQDVEYVFLHPDGLHSFAEFLGKRSAVTLERCEGCPADLVTFLAGDVDPDGPTCGLATPAALPVIVGSGDLSIDQACGRSATAPPRFAADPAAGTDLADLDGQLIQYLDDYLATLKVEAVQEGTLSREALLTVREMTSRGLHRRVGHDASRAGDNETALWALESAAGAQWSTTPRGWNDPEMVCLLALARFRAGRHRPVIEALDEAAGLPGWEVLAVVARMVARVEVLPGTDSVGVMR